MSPHLDASQVDRIMDLESELRDAERAEREANGRFLAAKRDWRDAVVLVATRRQERDRILRESIPDPDRHPLFDSPSVDLDTAPERHDWRVDRDGWDGPLYTVIDAEASEVEWIVSSRHPFGSAAKIRYSRIDSTEPIFDGVPRVYPATASIPAGTSRWRVMVPTGGTTLYYLDGFTHTDALVYLGSTDPNMIIIPQVFDIPEGSKIRRPDSNAAHGSPKTVPTSRLDAVEPLTPKKPRRHKATAAAKPEGGGR